MADVRGASLAKAVQKHAGRAKEKILQNLGKADKTTDDVFDDFETNFGKQQSGAARLAKEVSNYLRCARALHGANKSLFETLAEVYEPEWVGHDLLYAQAQNSDMLWTDFCHKLQDQTLTPLQAYAGQFPEVKKRIDKRGRKLVDYDSQRHQLEALTRSQRRDEYKIARSRGLLDQAKTTYEQLNKELYQELPELYDQRVGHVASHLQSLFSAEAVFMNEMSKVGKEVEAISDKLSKEAGKGTYKTTRQYTPRPLSIVEPKSSPAMWYGDQDVELKVDEEPLKKEEEPLKKDEEPLQEPLNSVEDLKIKTDETAETTVKEEIGRPYEEIEFEEKPVNGTTNGQVIGTSVPPGASTTDLPKGVLYRVKATYRYTREDVDEICFDVGDVIQVIEYPDPEEQEEGWLYGIKESTLEKGLFPANFTRPI